MLLSPSPSNAMPISASFSNTALDNSWRLFGVGSEPLPGKLPSIYSLIVITLQSSSVQSFCAVADCAPLPRSSTILNFLDLIFGMST